MKRAEVRWAELPPPIGSRPVVILTRDAAVNAIGGVVVVLVTRTIRDLTTEVALGRHRGLPLPCVANCENILTVPRQRLVRLMGECDVGKIVELDRAIRVALDVRRFRRLRSSSQLSRLSPFSPPPQT